MDFLITLAQQPLFRLLGAFIVLLLTDMNQVGGILACIVWIAWAYIGVRTPPTDSPTTAPLF